MKRKKLEPLLIAPLALEDSAAGAEYRRELLGKLVPHLRQAIKAFFQPFDFTFWKNGILLAFLSPIIYLGIRSEGFGQFDIQVVVSLLTIVIFVVVSVFWGQRSERKHLQCLFSTSQHIEQFPAVLLAKELTSLNRKQRQKLWEAEHFKVSPCLVAYLQALVPLYDSIHPGAGMFHSIWIEGILIATSILAWIGLHFLPHPVHADLAAALPTILGVTCRFRKMRQFRTLSLEFVHAIDEYNSRNQ